MPSSGRLAREESRREASKREDCISEEGKIVLDDSSNPASDLG